MKADYYMKNKSKVKNKNAENYKKKTAKKEATKSNEIVAENVLKSQKIKDKISKRKAVYYQTKLKPRKEVLKIETTISSFDITINFLSSPDIKRYSRMALIFH